MAYVYILASKPRGTLYVGVTSDLIRRIHEHRQGIVEGFTKKYGVQTLVYYEPFDDIENAIAREKQIKKWNRGWKVELIEKKNLHWEDLYHLICR
jgi:putative endonuclease